MSAQIASRKASDLDPAGYPDSSNLLLESIRHERNARTKLLHILKETSRLHERRLRPHTWLRGRKNLPYRCDGRNPGQHVRVRVGDTERDAPPVQIYPLQHQGGTPARGRELT